MSTSRDRRSREAKKAGETPVLPSPGFAVLPLPSVTGESISGVCCPENRPGGGDGGMSCIDDDEEDVGDDIMKESARAAVPSSSPSRSGNTTRCDESFIVFKRQKGTRVTRKTTGQKKKNKSNEHKRAKGKVYK